MLINRDRPPLKCFACSSELEKKRTAGTFCRNVCKFRKINKVIFQAKITFSARVTELTPIPNINFHRAPFHGSDGTWAGSGRNLPKTCNVGKITLYKLIVTTSSNIPYPYPLN